MTLAELGSHFEQECYNPAYYHIGAGWEACGDTFCIDRIGRFYEVFYVERGQRGQPIHCSENESEACEALLSLLHGERFSRAHCVGFFVARADADTLVEQLTQAGISAQQDAIPYGGPTDMRYRVFVFGRDKLRAIALITQTR